MNRHKLSDLVLGNSRVKNCCSGSVVFATRKLRLHTAGTMPNLLQVATPKAATTGTRTTNADYAAQCFWNNRIQILFEMNIRMMMTTRSFQSGSQSNLRSSSGSAPKIEWRMRMISTTTTTTPLCWNGMCRNGERTTIAVLKALPKSAIDAAIQKRKMTTPSVSSVSTVPVTFVEADGTEKTVDATVGSHLLDVAHDNAVELEGACGGELACSTCHLIFDEAVYNSLPPKREEEDDMLDLAMAVTPTYVSVFFPAFKLPCVGSACFLYSPDSVLFFRSPHTHQVSTRLSNPSDDRNGWNEGALVGPLACTFDGLVGGF